MLFKRIALLGLILSFVSSSYADSTKENVFCHYDIGDWWGSSTYDTQTDVIHIINCKWNDDACGEYSISKLSEHDGIAIYCDDKHSNIFINDNGNWRWNYAGCKFSPPEDLEDDDSFFEHTLYKYAFEYACPYSPPDKPRRLILIDKKDKIYSISCAEKIFKVFSSKENPIFYSSDNPVSVNKTLCE